MSVSLCPPTTADVDVDDDADVSVWRSEHKLNDLRATIVTTTKATFKRVAKEPIHLNWSWADTVKHFTLGRY